MDTLLTPAQIANVTFDKERHGYDRGSVDAFLEEVRATLARWIQAAETSEDELSRLRVQNENLRAQLDETSTASPRTGQVSESEQALGLLTLAQQTADQAVADAREQADRLLTAAESKAEELLTGAAEAADQTREQADTDAQACRTQARAQAAATVAEAQDRSRALLERLAHLRDAEDSLRAGVLALADQVRAAVAGDPVVPAADLNEALEAAGAEAGDVNDQQDGHDNRDAGTATVSDTDVDVQPGYGDDGELDEQGGNAEVLDTEATSTQDTDAGDIAASGSDSDAGAGDESPENSDVDGERRSYPVFGWAGR